MRRKSILVLVSLLAMLAALGSFLPTAVQAAPALRPASRETITGTLVAAPQPTPPTTLLLQVGSQTLPVSITGSTRVIDRASHPLGLTALHDGDSLRVDGAPNAAGGITATAIVDLTTPVSVPPPPTPSPSSQVTGTFASAPVTSLLCLLNTRVTGGVARPQVATASPCPSGQLPVYLIGATRYLGPAGQAIVRAQLRTGDTLRVTGSVISTHFIATLVQDLTAHPASPPPTPSPSSQVTGTFASAPVTSLLCLLNTRVTSGVARPQVATASPCPSGQLPVYLIGATRYLGPAGQAIVRAQLRTGDTLRVTGSVISAHFIATLVQDLTAHSAPPPSNQVTAQGVLAASASRTYPPVTLCLRDTQITSSKLRVPQVATASPCPSGQLPMYVIASTRIVGRNGGTLPLYQLRANDTLRVTGTVADGRLTASVLSDLSIL